MKKAIISVIGVIAVASIAGYLYFSRTGETPFQKAVPETIKDIKEKLGGDSDTSDWQTYQSSKFGFSIKYPSERLVKEDEHPSESGLASLSIIFLPGPEGQQEQWTKAPLIVSVMPSDSYANVLLEVKKAKSFSREHEMTPITVLGLKGIKVRMVQEGRLALQVILPYKNGVIMFMTIANDGGMFKEANPTFDAFLSTFKPQ